MHSILQEIHKLPCIVSCLDAIKEAMRTKKVLQDEVFKATSGCLCADFSSHLK